jgi:hypothetical protein
MFEGDPTYGELRFEPFYLGSEKLSEDKYTNESTNG